MTTAEEQNAKTGESVYSAAQRRFFGRNAKKKFSQILT